MNLSIFNCLYYPCLTDRVQSKLFRLELMAAASHKVLESHS
jgi:hypothetical protein